MKNIWPVVSAILALSGGLGVSYAVFKSATVTKTIELLKLENDALGKSVARLQSDQVTQSDQITKLDEQNRALRDVVTGRAAIEELARQIRHEEDARHQEHGVQETLLKDILAQLKGGRT